ncbi:MAG: TRAP transporter small permease [Desulfarculaceae bacterium]
MSNIWQQWNRIEEYLFGILALAALGCAFYGVIMRYIFSAPPYWNEEVSIYLIIWAVFITASNLAAKNGHVAATLLVEHLPIPARRFLAVINKFLILIFCLVISWYGLQMVWESYLMDQRSPTALRFPYWIAYLAVTTGCFLICLRSVIQIYQLIFNFHQSDILESHEMSRENVQK